MEKKSKVKSKNMREWQMSHHPSLLSIRKMSKQYSGIIKHSGRRILLVNHIEISIYNKSEADIIKLISRSLQVSLTRQCSRKRRRYLIKICHVFLLVDFHKVQWCHWLPFYPISGHNLWVGLFVLVECKRWIMDLSLKMLFN